MPDNTVSVKIQGEDDTAGAFAKADAEYKAFSRTIQDSNRAEVKSHMASAEAAGAHLRALRLLGDAEEMISHKESLGARLGSGLSSLLGSRGGGGIIGTLSSGLSALTSSGMGTATMFGALAVAAAAALAALMPLIASITLASVGFLGFAAVAAPEVIKMFQALSEHGKQLHNTMKQLSPAERSLVKEGEPLKDMFHRLQQAIQPEVIKAFATGIKIAKDLFPTFRTLVVAAGKAIDGFAKDILKWLEGPSGKKFISWMQTEGPKAIAEFGHALFTGMQWLGRFLDFMLNVGETMRRNWFRYMHDISNVLDVLRETFINVGHAIESAWNSTVHQVSALIDTLRGAFVSAGHTIEAIWNAIAGAASSAAGIIVGAISRISGALSAIPGMGILGSIAGKLGLATGGIAGAAVGGIQGGLRLVGEQGPELVRLPVGSSVYSAQQTPGMLGGGFNGPMTLQIEWVGTSASDDLLSWIRKNIRIRGGNVQTVLGRN